MAVVPRVYHYDPELQVTFQQAWDGESIAKGDAERPRKQWIRLLQATHALHSVAVPRGNKATLDARALLFKIRKDVADVTALLPQLQSLMESAQNTLTRTLERHTPHHSGFLHGSLLPSQILLGDHAVAFIDFDGTAEGDPLYDVAVDQDQPHVRLFELDFVLVHHLDLEGMDPVGFRQPRIPG